MGIYNTLNTIYIYAKLLKYNSECINTHTDYTYRWITLQCP